MSKGERGMPKLETEKKSNVITYSLAFRVKHTGDNLYAQEMLLLENDEVTDRRLGVATTLGHAIAAADDLMDGWAFSMIETKAEQYFREVLL
jgi:hypothetical protein